MNYRIDGTNIQYKSCTGAWFNTTYSPLELYNLEFAEVLSKEEIEFNEISDGILITDKYKTDIAIESHFATFEGFSRNFEEDLYIVVTNDSYEKIDLVLSFEDFDKIAEYVNRLRNLAERVRK